MSPDLYSTIVSVVLFILAGLALRYALWYGQSTGAAQSTDDGLQDHAGQETDRLNQDLAASQGSLEQAELGMQQLQSEREQLREERDELTAERSQLRLELEEVRAACELQKAQLDHLSLPSHDSQADRQGFEDQIEELKSSLDKYRSDYESVTAVLDQERARAARSDAKAERLQEEARQRESLEESLRRSEETIARLQADAKFAHALREKQSALQSSLHEGSERLQLVMQQRDEVLDENRTLRSELAELHATLHATSGQQVVISEKLHNSADQILKMTSNLDHTKEQLHQAQETIHQLQETVSELHQRAEAERHQLTVTAAEQMEQSQEQWQQARDSLHAELCDARAAAEAEKQHSEMRLAELQERLHHATEMVEDRDGQLADVRKQLSIAHDAIHGVRSELEHAKQSVVTAQIESEDVRGKLQTLAALREEMTELQTLQSKLTIDLDTERQRRHSIESSLTEHQRQIKTITDSFEEAQRQLQAESKDKLRLTEQIRRLRIEKEEALTRLESERNERIDLQESIQIHIDTLEELRADSMSLETLLERQSIVHGSLQQHADQLRSLARSKERHPNAAPESDPVPGNTASTHLVAVANATGTGSESLARAEKVLSFVEHKRTPQSALKGTLAHHPLFGMVYTSAPSDVDDLTEVSGIGEVLQEKLNGMGIYRFDQIMNWSPAVAAEISRHFAFKDRIVREEWIEQARSLHHHKSLRTAA